MAKPLGPKSLLIREAIQAHPDKGNTELAELIGSSDARREDKIKVTANDVAQQRQAMKKAGAAVPVRATSGGAKKGGAKGGRRRAGAQAVTGPAAQPRPTAAPAASPVDLIDKAFALAEECGGLEQLKKLVDRLTEAQGR
jgi:hypothetical protein